MKIQFLFAAVVCTWSVSFGAQAQTQEDPYFQLAQKAYESKDYKLCLISLKGSPRATQAQGLELAKACQEGETVPPTTATMTASISGLTITPPPPPDYNLFAKGRLGRTDNISQIAGGAERGNYALGAGGEYTFKEPFAYGIGASYDHFNAVDFGDAQGSTLSLYTPLGYTFQNHQISANGFYNLNTADGTNTYTEGGVSVGYYLHLEKYLFSLSDTYSKRWHKDKLAAYQTGQYNSIQLNAIRHFGKLSVGLGANRDRNESGDIPFGVSNIIPWRHTAQGFSVSTTYNLNDASKITARYKKAKLDFENKGGTWQTKRDDTIQSTSLTYTHVFSQHITMYLQQTYTDNESTFNSRELQNKNYSENSTALGVTVYSR